LETGRKDEMMAEMGDDADLMPLEAAASEFGLALEVLRSRVRTGDVPGVYVPDAGGWFVHRSDLEALNAPA
jgi:hypothetical protein